MLVITLVLSLIATFAPAQEVTKEISDAQKKEFIELLKKLPTKGEFYTEESVQKAAPYLPVFFALTEGDIKKYDIYPFLALSRGLADQKEHRDYAVKHFDEVRHPTLKLSWGVILFMHNEPSPQIVRFLRNALESKPQAKVLSDMLGPEFENFQKRVKAYPDDKK
jgi:hypothetical protein